MGMSWKEVRCGHCDVEFLTEAINKMSTCPVCYAINNVVTAIPMKEVEMSLREPVVPAIPVKPSFVSVSANVQTFRVGILHAADCKCSVCFKTKEVPVDLLEDFTAPKTALDEQNPFEYFTTDYECSSSYTMTTKYKV